MGELRLGLLADSSIQLSNLKSIVTSAQYKVAAEVLTRSENLKNIPQVDIWVARIDGEDKDSLAFMEYLDNLDVPVIFDEADSYSSLDTEERARRFSAKISASILKPAENLENLNRAREVWVLGASTGGPEAVIRFIKMLPDDLPGVAFIYTQHIDAKMALSLRKSLSRHTTWPVLYSAQAHIIYEKCFYMVAPDNQLEVDRSRQINPISNPWGGPYSPSIDEVMAKVALRYGKDSGVIVFSGMGDDGAKSCKVVKRMGGKVWVQSPKSCVIDSMPQEAIKSQCVSYIGSPELLAKHFIATQRSRTDKLLKNAI
ncbi:Chemotaxis response regulator protein-glutamate methylesterase [Thalassocella blandensis]|nr:Chemotaxis response regulator protein-glutamate methylesterase [Thalassocella blandensis]